MAELSVSASYESRLTRIGAALLSLTFPIWGIFAPLFAAIILFSLATSIIPSSGPGFAVWLGVPIAWICVAIFSLLAMRALSRNRLLLDKTGIQFPFFLKPLRSCIPWTFIRRVEIREGKSQADKAILIYVAKGKPLKLKIKNMKPADLEQVLLAFELWGKNCERDHSLLLLQDSLKCKAEDTGKLSYTTMWENELRRKFSPTTFLPLNPGQILHGGRLKVVRHLSLGGLSAVYLCQLDENQLVVLKEAVLPEDGDVEMREKAKELFEREAKLLTKLSHRGIVPVLEYFAEGGRNYLLLEYVNGQDLRQYIKQHGAQNESTVLDWAIQIANIMKYLHEQSPPVIHRDLSPDNLVLREDGTIIVIDFGAANEFLSKATGTFVGKQAFIAPEQFRGKAVPQSDIYAFGCTLFYCLTSTEPEALSSSNPKEKRQEISDELNELVVSCTQMDAKDRYQSAAQLLPVLRKMHSLAHISS